MKKPKPSILILLIPFILIGSNSPADKAKEQLDAARIERWEQTIRNFEALDKKAPPPKSVVLLVGGSNARRWTDVRDYLPGDPVINRGFGGARLTEVLHFADRIDFPYEPKVILVNAGGNDLNAGSTPSQVRETAKAFIEAVRDKLPDTPIYFIGLPYVKRAYGNPEAEAVVRDFNKQLSGLAQQNSKVGFIDILPAFLGDNGAFKPELFVSDGTHYSPEGYTILARLIREKLSP